MDSGTKELLKAAIAQFNLSGRGYDRILLPKLLTIGRSIENCSDEKEKRKS